MVNVVENHRQIIVKVVENPETNHSKRGSALPQNQMTIMPVNRPPPKIGGVIARRPLKFNY